MQMKLSLYFKRMFSSKENHLYPAALSLKPVWMRIKKTLQGARNVFVFVSNDYFWLLMGTSEAECLTANSKQTRLWSIDSRPLSSQASCGFGGFGKSATKQGPPILSEPNIVRVAPAPMLLARRNAARWGWQGSMRSDQTLSNLGIHSCHFPWPETILNWWPRRSWHSPSPPLLLMVRSLSRGSFFDGSFRSLFHLRPGWN